MNFPALIRTKAEAQSLAAELFPSASTALAKLPPGITHPRCHLTHQTADLLRELLLWLYEQKPRIYKRARWHFFYDIAHRSTRLLDENAKVQIHDLYSHDRWQAWQRARSAQIMTGDGDGI